MRQGCPEFQARLADYADRSLGERERREAQAHLAQCIECRVALCELQWIETLLVESFREAPVERLLTLPIERIESPHVQRFGWVRPALSAAAALLAFAAWGLYQGIRVAPQAPNHRSVAVKNAAGAKLPSSESPSEPSQWADVEAAIEREASAARLAASAEVLAAQAGADVYALESWRLLAETFPDTHAGRKAARRLESSLGERNESTE